MQGKVAVLGDEDFVMPFATLGMDTYKVTADHDAIIKAAAEIVEAKYALIIVAENVATDAEEVFADLRKKAVPAIIVLPFTTEPTGIATTELAKALRMATGIDLLTDQKT